ncbi:cysteine hydrolase family protein [Euzebya tangerina]|uniref:cysteine hydrolase family protein n=1 Tax=Euzebya tangerina TaxID=591198 RepID=UPI000E320B1B|nr:isochorismatase family protein [Euzebya tangerina]
MSAQEAAHGPAGEGQLDEAAAQRDRYTSLGFGSGRVGLGTLPAALVVDMQLGFLEHGLGTDRSEETLATISRVLDACRTQDVPIFYLRVLFEADDPGGIIWREKVPAVAACKRGSDRVQIHPAIAPQPGERLIDKRWASAFFQTPLHEELQALGVDAVMIMGTSTGGCVRATVVDAAQHDYRVTVVADGCEDRSPLSHQTCLVDFDAKYADVAEADDVIARLAELVGGLPTSQAR